MRLICKYPNSTCQGHCVRVTDLKVVGDRGIYQGVQCNCDFQWLIYCFNVCINTTMVD